MNYVVLVWVDMGGYCTNNNAMAGCVRLKSSSDLTLSCFLQADSFLPQPLSEFSQKKYFIPASSTALVEWLVECASLVVQEPGASGACQQLITEELFSPELDEMQGCTAIGSHQFHGWLQRNGHQSMPPLWFS